MNKDCVWARAVRLVMAAKGYDLKSAGVFFGVHPTTVSRWCMGGVFPPSDKNKDKIFDALCESRKEINQIMKRCEVE